MDFINGINKVYKYINRFIFVVLPLSFILISIGMIMSVIFIFTSEVNESGDSTRITISKIPESVLKHKDIIIKYMKEYDIPMIYLPYILAQATQESYGKEPDIFQASESKYNGEMGKIKSAEESIEHAMKRWREIIDEIEKRKLIFSVELVLQTYNFGSGFLSYVEKNGKEYTEKVAKDFSNLMLSTLKDWKYNVYGDIYYIKNIFRYLVFEYDENFDMSGIVLKTGDKETLENFVSDFGTPNIESVEGGISGVENYSYKYYGRQCVSWCYNRWFEVHGWNTGKMADGGRWNEAVNGKNLIVLQSPKEKEAVRSGCTISFSGGKWGQYGHIAFIEKILPNGTLIISEQNYDNKGSFRQRFCNKDEWLLDSNYFV